MKYSDNKYTELYKKVISTVERNYGFLGVNKKREIIRLIYEIAKIKKTDNLNFIPEYKNYTQFKKELIKIRYPLSYKLNLNQFYLPKLNLSENYVFRKKDPFKIEKIIIEEQALNTEFAKNILKKFPDIKPQIIKTIKEIKKNFDIEKYNERQNNIYVVYELYDFLKRCPCTKNCFSCNYQIINIGFGCPLECQYCFLQGYQNIDGIILPANINDFLNNFDSYYEKIEKPFRIGSGEFTDSLVFDNITEYSIEIVKKFSNYRDVFFEFKTKTTNIENLLKLKPSSNIVIAFSLNPQKIIEKTEFYTSSFKDRLNSMRKLLDYGYSTAFHLDPIIWTENWEQEYQNMIKDIFSVISPEEIKWVSLGTFRFRPETKRIIETRFPDNIILDAEMIIDFDGKLRYPPEIRKDIYSKIINYLIINGLEKDKIYLCMENIKMWKELNLNFKFSWQK